MLDRLLEELVDGKVVVSEFRVDLDEEYLTLIVALCAYRILSTELHGLELRGHEGAVGVHDSVKMLFEFTHGQGFLEERAYPLPVHRLQENRIAFPIWYMTVP